MTHDKELFKELRSTEISKVKIGNGQHITVKGKVTIAIASCSGIKLISDVLHVLVECWSIFRERLQSKF